MWTHVCIHKLTTLGTASCSIFTALWCGPHPPSWIWLVGTTVQIMPRLHHIMDTCQVGEFPDSTISKVLTVLKWQMITTFNRKLLEKQRVQNHFASYEVHIGPFFYNVNATVSFWNCLTLSIFRFQNFSLDWQTDRQPKPIAEPLRACAHGVTMYDVWCIYTIVGVRHLGVLPDSCDSWEYIAKSGVYIRIAISGWVSVYSSGIILLWRSQLRERQFAAGISRVKSASI